MSLMHELLLEAELHERERQLARHRLAPQARPVGRTSRGTGAPAAGRLLQLLAELYGPTARPDQDPALFSRLAWTGSDD
jgi:hypothetical protein